MPGQVLQLYYVRVLTPLVFVTFITHSRQYKVYLQSRVFLDIIKQDKCKKLMKFCNTVFNLILEICFQVLERYPNPGPTSDPSPKYPCGTCSHEVHDHHRAICDQCDSWYHTACVQINDTTYEQLKYHSVLWFCSCCGLPNYSECLFASNINTSNLYTVLESLPQQ